ncbi:MAG: SGNH/GDSL hydrolase family protein [Acidimicrobiia bacterium]
MRLKKTKLIAATATAVMVMAPSLTAAALTMDPVHTCAASTTLTKTWYVIGDSISARNAFGAGDALCWWFNADQKVKGIINATGGATYSDHRLNSSFMKAKDSKAPTVIIELGTNDVSRTKEPKTADAVWTAIKSDLSAALTTLNPTPPAGTKNQCIVLVGLNENQDKVAGVWARHYSSAGAKTWNQELKKMVAKYSNVKYLSFETFGAAYPGMLTDGIHPSTSTAKTQYARTIAWATKYLCG